MENIAEVWHGGLQREGHTNPSSMPLESTPVIADQVMLGAYDMTEIARGIEGVEKLTLAALPEQAKAAGYQLNGDAL